MWIKVVLCDFGRVYYVSPYKTGSRLHAESTTYFRLVEKVHCYTQSRY